MSKLLDFPQRQHEEFSRIVREAVELAASAADLRLEDYIQTVYYQDVNPPLFSSEQSLLSLYQQYPNLIESALSSVENSADMKNSSKTYLCYRIYLHSMTIERKVLSEDDAKIYLLRAMREYFYARGKIMSFKDEEEVLQALNLAVEQANPLKQK